MRRGTATQRLVDHLLGGNLDEFVQTRRKQTPQVPWRIIARDIYEQTGVDITYETLRGWFPEDRRDTGDAA